MIAKWKSALSEIAELSGHHLRKEANEYESDIIQEIVGNVATRASTTVSHLEKYIFGIDSAVEEIYQKLSMESNDVRAIGICGMGGIGKTTIAKALYDKYFNKFDISCFNENVKQYSQGGSQYSQGGSPLLPLLKQLLIDLLRKKDYKVTDIEIRIRRLKQILHSKKALIILDDLDQSTCSELLANLGNLFSSGSRIIITTRDANLLNKLKVDISEVDIYMVKTLGYTDSLELFSYHAFRKSVPPENFRELSLRFVAYAGGLPLALKVLGSSLLGRTYEFWKTKLVKVQEISENDIQKILKLSYDELDDDTEKTIFLDIAFFFVGKDKDEAVHVFKSCNFFPDVGIPILVDRCLLTIDTDNKFEMHNLIQKMGRELGKSTRLFLRGNAWTQLQNSEPIKQLNNLGCLYLSECRDLKRLPEQLGFMKCLKMIDASYTAIEKLPDSITHLKELAELNLGYCDKLRELPEQLGEMKGLKKLDAGGTVIKQLPDSITQLKGLVRMELHGCRKLRKLPEDIGNMKGLEIFRAGSTAIEQLPESFVDLINLEILNLKNCQNLRNLPNSIWELKCLRELHLWRCSKLERLPQQLGKMLCLEELSASYTSIKEVPDSIGLLSRLQVLELNSCEKLKCVPESIWNLTSIKTLSLRAGDTGKISLPDSVKNMKLSDLHLSCNVRLCLPMILSFSSLERLTLTDEGQNLSSAKPFSLSKLFNLQDLTLDKCTSLGSSLPELPLNLQELYVFNHSSLQQLPDLWSLKKLKHLYIKGCIYLQSISLLPSHLQSLVVEGCTSLQDLPDLSMLKELINLSFTRCNNLKSISLKQSSLQARLHSFSFRADLPNREVAEWFNYKSSGCTVSFDIPPISGSNFLGLALWVVYTCKAADENNTYIKAVITNNMENMTENYQIYVHTVVGEAQSSVQCITGDGISMESGDRIKVSFRSLLYSDDKFEVPIGEVKVKIIGVHVIPSTSVH